MKVAILPFTAAEGTSPALARQLANFAGDTVRAATNQEINQVGLMTEVEQGGVRRQALVNFTETLIERSWIEDLVQQTGVDRVLDGNLKANGEGSYTLIYRFHGPGAETEPLLQREVDFSAANLFEMLRTLVADLTEQTGVEVPKELANLEFGTEDPAVFLKFLEAYDALTYIQQANGAVVQEFSPIPALEALTEAAETDPDFEGPYHSLIALARISAANRLGTFEAIESSLKRLQAVRPDDFGAFFALGEVYQAVGNVSGAIDEYERAVQKDPNDPALLVRLGIAQMQSGLPVNAERNFRKALEFEGEEKPSLDYLAAVLQQTKREHEIPAIWKSQLELNPQNAQTHAKYAISLIQAGRQEEGQNAFEQALETLEDNAIIKRYYAPMLAQGGELDRAMDFYEDVLDLAPNDIDVLLEYARTLAQAKRDFEIPKVLRDVLDSNPDPNVRAQTLAWLIELEQPKRVETVENARAKMEIGDFDAAVRLLRPMRNWLADYWKLWALLSAGLNRLGLHEEAEEAARKLINLFPGCEPAYGEIVAALGALGKNEEAYAIMRNAAAMMPASLPTHVNLGLAAKRAGHTDEARALARQLREAVGDNPELEPVLSEMES
jgi:tetratricopeptide (TPR) repeat protein